jgi:hypothetical protein
MLSLTLRLNFFGEMSKVGIFTQNALAVAFRQP